MLKLHFKRNYPITLVAVQKHIPEGFGLQQWVT